MLSEALLHDEESIPKTLRKEQIIWFRLWFIPSLETLSPKLIWSSMILEEEK